MKKNILILFLILFCFSCSINGNFKGLYSYYKSTYMKNPTLFYHPKKNNEIVWQKEKIYVINANYLKEKFQKSMKSKKMVFIWTPRCTSKYCYSLSYLQNFCNVENIDLYVVAEYYDNEYMTVNYSIDKPIFAIDTDYYKTNLTNSYLNKFLSELDIKKTTKYNENRIYYFKNNDFIANINDINILKSHFLK